MTDRDKLIELFKGAESKVIEELNKHLELDEEEWMGIYADHLIANGVIVPPCKVGDIVYSSMYDWQKAKDVVTPYQITNITITQNKKGVWTKKYRAMRVLNGKTIDCQLNFEFDTIGKTVFLTREEAEKALERSKG